MLLLVVPEFFTRDELAMNVVESRLGGASLLVGVVVLTLSRWVAVVADVMLGGVVVLSDVVVLGDVAMLGDVVVLTDVAVSVMVEAVVCFRFEPSRLLGWILLSSPAA